MKVIWSEKDSYQVTISNQGLTATVHTHDNSSVVSNELKSNGKWYAEIRVDTISDLYTTIGIIDGSVNIPSYGVGLPWTKMRCYKAYGKKYGGTDINYGASFKVGDIIGIILDKDNGTIAFTKNGVNQGIAFTDINTFNSVKIFIRGTGTYVANFGATPFAYSIPTGYRSYDNSQPRLDKILIKTDTSYLYLRQEDNQFVPLGHEPTDADFLNLGLDKVTKAHIQQLGLQGIKGRKRIRRL